jgi:hypothetical protein
MTASNARLTGRHRSLAATRGSSDQMLGVREREPAQLASEASPATLQWPMARPGRQWATIWGIGLILFGGVTQLAAVTNWRILLTAEWPTLATVFLVAGIHARSALLMISAGILSGASSGVVLSQLLHSKLTEARLGGIHTPGTWARFHADHGIASADCPPRAPMAHHRGDAAAANWGCGVDRWTDGRLRPIPREPVASSVDSVRCLGPVEDAASRSMHVLAWAATSHDHRPISLQMAGTRSCDAMARSGRAVIAECGYSRNCQLWFVDTCPTVERLHQRVGMGIPAGR